MAKLNLNNVRKSYGKVPVIHGVSIDIEDGEFVTLVGPSGCGKSTLLRMIAGLEPITGGEISIGDRIVNDLAPRDRDIAMVFQSYALYPHKNVADNMGYALKLAKRPQQEIERRVNEAAEVLDLTPLLGRKPAQLSGGQRQRVAMGRAIVRDPKVFLFDEPLSNLDAKLRVAMRAEIKELQHRLKTTTVYVTHDQIEAMTMADRIVVMRAGIVEQVGRPLELYDSPSNVFVASFMGSPAMNLITGSVAEEAGKFEFVSEGGARLPLDGSVPAKRRDKLVLGVRPEHISLVDAGTVNSFTSKVVVTEPTGAETLISSRIGSTEIVVAVRDRFEVAMGDEAQFAFNFERLHYFDAENGQRLS
ncbi:sn-glycerol-3-phosphate ABC transporter ATP-binding protein UgpC [Devosia algicola]|uniref:Sn-glycerol-3-phosphate ABC transporter ATP-binding protein UgpC n=1 Tax=Devosia algicola TaxID=3026418 RepID=A0ABY7YJB6_9HYPH|nr:sn-glycerol-3-phosphate ABC transporter ATP-binding protein UgpC [Devosia algicola]WDR01277.1 sn-glycerol-3-phosphate ABC transporter ATP-binding protein UgpC [Devosia algicola]